PYALVHINQTWLLTAYCHLRRDLRHFRLDRMEDVTVLDQVFKRPADFEISPGNQDDRTIEVRALFDQEVARRVRENPSYYQVAEEELPEGLLVTLKVRQPGEVLNWLLSWGSHVRVLEPDAAREMLAREAQAILETHRIGDLSL